MLLNLANTLTQVQGIQQTYVASAISAGGTSSPVKNIGGLTNQYGVQIGQTGEETAEIMIISGAPSGTVVNFGTSPSHTAGTLFYAHAQDTPIYQINYDQVIFYRSTAGTGGPFTALATVSIQPDSLYTSYNDTGGASGYAYYAQYYNSVSTNTSGSSSIFVPGGPTFYSLQALRTRVKDKLFSAGYIRDDSVITDWINEWYELMTNAAIKVNQGYLIGTNQYGFGTSGIGTVTDSAFKQPIKVEITYDGATYLPSVPIAARSFTEQDYFDAASPRHSWIGETVFEALPHTQAGTARITYSTRFTPLVNDSDELTQTLKAYTTSCVEYCLGVAYGLDQKDTQSQQHMQTYMALRNDFVAEITPRDMSNPEMIDLPESTSGLVDDVAQEFSDFVW